MSAKELYILPFDHRATFARDLFGYSGKLNSRQKSEVSSYKNIAFEAFLSVYKKEKNKQSLGILVDEEFGGSIIREAKKRKINVSVPSEKSGQKVFDFEYGAKFGQHILKIKPDYSKVLVRYNPDNENGEQLKRLKKANDFCRKKKIGFLFELLVPPTESQAKLKYYDERLRPELTKRAIMEIRAFGIEPDIWKLEAMPDKKGWKDVIEAIKYRNPLDARIIVLGRAGSVSDVKNWLRIASAFPEIIGFAVGRTIFFSPLEKYHNKKITRKKAVELIAKGFKEFLVFWKQFRK